MAKLSQQKKQTKSSNNDDTDMVQIIQRTKKILDNQINLYEDLDLMDREEIANLTKLVTSVKSLSAEERAWESLYGVNSLTEDQLQDEAEKVLSKLGITYTKKSIKHYDARDKKENTNESRNEQTTTGNGLLLPNDPIGEG